MVVEEEGEEEEEEEGGGVGARGEAVPAHGRLRICAEGAGERVRREGGREGGSDGFCVLQN